MAIAAGCGSTVTTAFTVHVVAASVNTTVALPDDTPVIEPDEDPIVAIVAGVAVQVPTPEPSVKVTEEPTQALPGTGTVGTTGAPLTVTVAVAVQPASV